MDDPVATADALLAALPVEHDDHWSLREATAEQVAAAERLWAAVTREPVEPAVVAHAVPALARAVQHLALSAVPGHARALGARVHEDCLRLLGADHVMTAAAAHALGTALDHDDDDVRAVPLFEQAVQTRDHRLGPRHPDALESRLSRATSLRATAPRPASDILVAATSDAEAVLGEGHPSTLNALVAIALAHRQDGETDLARDVLEEVVARAREHLGHDHHETIRLRAFALWPWGDHAPELDRLAQESARILGGEHAQTLRLRLQGALGALLADPRGGRRRVLAELENHRRVLGPRHPWTLLALTDTGEFLAGAGLGPQARETARSVLALRRDLSGPDHPAVLRAAHWCGLLAWLAGDLAEAVTANDEAARVTRALLGASHPLTVAALCRLGDMRTDAGADAGVPVADADLAAAAHALNASHGPGTEPTLRVRSAAARRLAGGDPERALPVLRDIAERADGVAGRDLPLRAWLDLADALTATGERREARSVSKRVLRAGERFLPPDHPLLVRCRTGRRLFRRTG